jgi:putative heme-binding domain-containing protein
VRRPFLGVAAFTITFVVAVAAIGEMITRVSGEGARHPAPAATAGALTPETGERIFWGPGKCSTCHAVGSRGGAIRGPNQGEAGPLGLPIGIRAAERARERAQATGKPYTATDYLVESLVDPGAYVVQGFKNEMPDPLRPPIRLSADEVRAVIAYLQSLGGRVDVAAIKLPAGLEARAATADGWSPYIAGDPKKGEKLFFAADGSAACGTCHRVGDRGGTVGPELTAVAGTRDARFIVESILEPSKVIASGYEATLVVTKAERYVTGIVTREDAESIELADGQGRSQRVSKRDIRQRAPQTTSLMPGNFKEILTVEEFHDVLAFVLALK